MAFGGSLTTVSDVLKQGYEGPVREQINREALIYQLFEEGPHSWEGNTIIIPTHVGGVASTAISYAGETSGADRATLSSIGSVADSQTYGKLVVDSAYLYASFMVTGQAMAKAPQQAGESPDAFVGAMWSEMNGLSKDIRNKLNKDMFTGQGAVAFLVDNDGAIGAGPIADRVISGANHLTVGDFVKLVHIPRDPAASWQLLRANNAGPTVLLSTVFQITAKDEFNGTCSIQAVDVADALIAARGPEAAIVGATELVLVVKVLAPTVSGAHAALTVTSADLAGTSLECVGLNALGFLPHGNGAFTNDRHGTSNTILRGQGFKSASISSGPGAAGFSAGNQLDLEDVQLVMDGLAELVEGYETDCLIMHRFTRAEFLRIIQASREVMGVPGVNQAPGYRYEPGKDLATDPMGISYHGVPVKVSKDVPLGVIYLINRESINIYTLKQGAFETFHSGEVITQVRNGAGDFVDAKEGFWKQYFQMVSEAPRAIGVLAGVKYKKA